MQILVVTSSGRRAATRVLLDSLHVHEPDLAVTLLISDPRGDAGRPDVPTEGGHRHLLAGDLTVGGIRYVDLWMAGGPSFAAWAVVPSAVHALDTHEAVLVLPEHAWVTAPLGDWSVGVTAEELALVARHHDPVSGVNHGGWVEGVAVVGSSRAPALDAWQRRAIDAIRSTSPSRADVDVDFEHPWVRFVDGGTTVRTLHDAGLRVGPDTVGSVVVGLDDQDHLTADGAPLRLARFPGFDPSTRWWYAPDGSEPGQLVSANPALRALCHRYAEALDEIGAAPTLEPTLVGIRRSPALHAAFRSRLATCLDEGTTPPNPLRAGEVGDFVDWLRGPGAADGTGVSLAADLVWSARPDLAAAFPNVRWGGRAPFVRWLWTHGLDEGLVSTAVLPDLAALEPRTAATTTGSERRFGVNLIGYHDAELGLGVAVRRIGAALDAAQIPWVKVTYDRTNSRRRQVSDRSTDAPFWFNLILIAPDQLGFFVGDVGTELLDGHHNIGLWYWETDVMRPSQIAAFDHLDEVWGATSYLRDVFAAHTDKPVELVPLPLEFPTSEADAATRARLGFDDRFTFAFSFDFLSIVQRKNPLELVTAYRRAFSPDDGARLILKSINGDRHLREIEEIRDAIADRDDIELWDRYLDAADRISLVACADCYVSLHRSEGLGLTMAEAMAAGTPVIATAYSGNLDFMAEESALLVNAKEIEIGEGSFYPADGHWAQPDLDHAAALMREIRSDDALRRRLRTAGPLALRPFTSARVGATIRRLLKARWDDC